MINSNSNHNKKGGQKKLNQGRKIINIECFKFTTFGQAEKKIALFSLLADFFTGIQSAKQSQTNFTISIRLLPYQIVQSKCTFFILDVYFGPNQFLLSFQ